MHSLPEHFEWQKLEKLGQYVIYAHLLFLVLFIAFLIRRLDKNDIGSYRARLVHEKLKGSRASDQEFAYLEDYSTRQVRRLKRRFFWFWCAMLCLYLIFAIEPMFSVANKDGSPALNAVADCLQALNVKQLANTQIFPFLSFALNNLSLLFVFQCFSVLYLPPDATPRMSLDAVSSPPGGDAFQQPHIGLPKRTWLAFYGLLRNLGRYLRGQGLDEPERRQRIMVVWFFVGVVILTLMFPLIARSKLAVPTNWSEYPAVFDALSGTINAIVLALLVAKLDSKLIGLPSWLICMLYFYAGVQPMFVVFELHPEVYAGIKTAVLWVVFIFKIYFFLIIFYALQTGRVFNCFFCSEVLNDHVKRLEEAQKEARLLMSLESPSKGKLWQRGFEKVSLALIRFFTASKPSPSISTETSPPTFFTSPPTFFEGIGIELGKKDARAIWCQRVGVVAILFFGGSLLVYVWLSEKSKEWIDQSRLSVEVVRLHIILLFIILGFISYFILRDRRRDQRGFPPSDEPKFRAPSALILELSEPMSPKQQTNKIDKLSNRTREQFKSFTRYFRLFWISLLVLYLLMFVKPPENPNPSETCRDHKEAKTLSEPKTNFSKEAVPYVRIWFSGPGPKEKPSPSEPGSAPLEDEAKVLFGTTADFSKGSLLLVKAALSEHNQTTPQPDRPSETAPSEKSDSTDSQWGEPRFPIAEMPGKAKYAFGFFVVNNFSVLFLFWCFAVLYIPNDDEKFDDKHRLLRRYSVLLFVLLTAIVPLLAMIIKGDGFTQSEIDKIPTILGAVGGTLNAVAFALLIARLDSRIIRLRLPLVTVLYAYAALQPLFVTFNQPSNLLKFIATSAMIAAFLFKICLVLMVGYIRNSGGLIDYLWFFPILSKSVNAVFGNQFEIKTYSPKPGWFTFSIFNKHSEKYRAVEIYPSRIECDYDIKELVEAMKIRANYSEAPEPLQGTHCVQVKANRILLCESVGLRLSEVNELINESIEKVPFCKYDRG